MNKLLALLISIFLLTSANLYADTHCNPFFDEDCFTSSYTGEEVNFQPVKVAHTKSYGYQITSELARKGNTSERFEVRHGDCVGWDCQNDRQRYEVGIIHPFIEDDNWYSWSFHLPNNFMIQPSKTAIGQAKLQYGPVLWIVGTGKKNPDWIDIHPETYQESCNLIKVKDAIGKWTDIIIGASYSPSNYKPIDVYINGKNTDCKFSAPLISKKRLNTKNYRRGTGNKVAFKYGIYQAMVSKWLDKHKTKEISGDVDIVKWRKPWNGKCCKSPDNTPFNEDWGIEIPTAVIFYDEVMVGRSRSDVNIFYDVSILDAH